MDKYYQLINDLTIIEPKTILEIGSMDGNDAFKLKTSFNLSDSDVWVVEPSSTQQEIIKNNYPTFNLITEAIYYERGEKMFNQVNGPDAGTSSLYDRTDSWYELQGNGLVKRMVKTITGEDLLNIINKPIEICKLDVEGLTYEVLKSFGDKLTQIKSFHLESEHREVWKGQILYNDIKDFLISKNYKEIYFKYVADGDLQSDSVWVINDLLK
jgi:FkbM family methyltransferase